MSGCWQEVGEMKRYQFKMIGDMENKITIGRREASISAGVFLSSEWDAVA